MENKDNIEYDSTPDALKHIENIQNVFNLIIIPELRKRALNHDKSKLSSPEKECYDKYIPLLRKYKYGTKEYTEVRNNMQKEGLDHHFKENRHHPEHFENMMHDFTIIDLVEMVCDHFAASLVSDTSFKDGIKINAKKYDYPEMFVHILENTYDEYFESFEKIIKKKDPGNKLLMELMKQSTENHHLLDNQDTSLAHEFDMLLHSIKIN